MERVIPFGGPSSWPGSGRGLLADAAEASGDDGRGLVVRRGGEGRGGSLSSSAGAGAAASASGSVARAGAGAAAAKGPVRRRDLFKFLSSSASSPPPPEPVRRTTAAPSLRSVRKFVLGHAADVDADEDFADHDEPSYVATSTTTYTTSRGGGGGAMASLSSPTSPQSSSYGSLKASPASSTSSSTSSLSFSEFHDYRSLPHSHSHSQSQSQSQSQAQSQSSTERHNNKQRRTHTSRPQASASPVSTAITSITVSQRRAGRARMVVSSEMLSPLECVNVDIFETRIAPLLGLRTLLELRTCSRAMRALVDGMLRWRVAILLGASSDAVDWDELSAREIEMQVRFGFNWIPASRQCGRQVWLCASCRLPVLLDVTQTLCRSLLPVHIPHDGIKQNLLQVMFETSCRFGNLSTAQWLAGEYRSYFDQESLGTIHSSFLWSCANGYRDQLLWLCERFAFRRTDIVSDAGQILMLCCFNNQLETVQWLVQHFDLSREIVGCDNNAALESSCAGGHVNVAAWLKAFLSLTKEDVLRTDAFVRACSGGHIATAKWLLQEFRIGRDELQRVGLAALTAALGNDHVHVAEWLSMLVIPPMRDVCEAFRDSCGRGQLGTAQWLAQHYCLTKGDSLGTWCGALSSSCAGGHLRLARWIVQHFGLRRADMEKKSLHDALRLSCLRNHLAVVQWLTACFDISRKHIMRDSNTIFIGTCAAGSLAVAQWLADHFGLTKRDACAFKCEAFRKCCANGHLEMAQWLIRRFRMSRTDVFVCDREALNLSLRNGHIQLCQWLIETYDVHW